MPSTRRTAFDTPRVVTSPGWAELVRRVPLLSGSRLLIVGIADDAVLLRPPPPPPEPIADVSAAVRDALRFPLTGSPLGAVVPRNGRVTILTEPAALPVPSAEPDPRQAAIAAAHAELRRAGVADERMTILVAGGLARRAGRRELEGPVAPRFALDFAGRVLVHDVEEPSLVELGAVGDVPLRVNRALIETDLVLVVTAAETVLHGGPATLLAAGGREALRAASASSLLETSGSFGWQLAIAFERALAARVPVLGASLALNHPRLPEALWGYPYEEESPSRIARSPLARLFRVLPAPVRMRALRSINLELTASAAFAGPPSVAHAEALLRAIELRSAELGGQLEVLCLGVPRVTPHLPRERPNPLIVAYLGLGFALRLWRDAFPVVEGGTAILLHRFHRHFSHPTQQPYRAFFAATRSAGRPDPSALSEAERGAAEDARALQAYRSGRTCHPLLPFVDWDACRPALGRLGHVLIAGCRD